jgi:hypothetical protein
MPRTLTEPQKFVTVYISIGNSDDKLPQAGWHNYVCDVESAIYAYAWEVHGIWLSESRSRYQNACWCIEIAPKEIQGLIDRLTNQAHVYDQDSIAWAEVSGTQFLGAAK